MQKLTLFFPFSRMPEANCHRQALCVTNNHTLTRGFVEAEMWVNKNVGFVVQRSSALNDGKFF